jgi:hypothetical protein
MEDLENEVLEETEVETAEETTEEASAEETQPEVQEERKFTQREVDEMVKKKLDEVLPGKIARREARIQKEKDREYGELMGLLRAGTGKESVQDITGEVRRYYGDRGVKPKAQPEYSEEETQTLASADAKKIIAEGLEEVVYEVDRLAKLGAKMNPRERAMFTELATYRAEEERKAELEKLGVSAEEYNSQEFRDFAKKFDKKTPVGEIWEIYAGRKPKKNIQTAGSVKSGATAKGVKDYYTPEEISRLDDELDDDRVWEAVRRSMTGR